MNNKQGGFVTIEQLRTRSNHQIFISLARGLHQFYDHGGISHGRSYQSRLFEAFYFRLKLNSPNCLTLLTGEHFHNGKILGHISEERFGKTKRIRCVNAKKIERLREVALRYLLIGKMIQYYESGNAKSDGWITQTPL